MKVHFSELINNVLLEFFTSFSIFSLFYSNNCMFFNNQEKKLKIFNLIMLEVWIKVRDINFYKSRFFYYSTLDVLIVNLKHANKQDFT